MIKEFKAVSNSTIYDICLNTYGTLDLLVKLMADNNHNGVTVYPLAGAIYKYDESLVNVRLGQNLSNIYTVEAGESQLKYATKP
jgi:hypothetical protein